jgi:microcompartment protein CcmK/EutM
MFLAHVTGVIVATIKHPHLHGRKLCSCGPSPRPAGPSRRR